VNVAIIGTGRMGTALGARVAAAGHAVHVGSRDGDRAAALAERIGAASGGA
jgi:8-hydroxy-5-deazaflavin:NADPH oxidoreductase